MEKDLRILLQNLVNEFVKRKNEFLSCIDIGSAYKVGYYAEKGQTRASNTYTYHKDNIIDFQTLAPYIGSFFRMYSNVDEIKLYFTLNKLWHNLLTDENKWQFENYILYSIVGGFICRIFVINNAAFIVTEASFNKALNELLTLINRDYVTHVKLIHLKGVIGEPDDLQLADNVNIYKATFELARFFSINYFVNSGHLIQVMEGDYLLTLAFRFAKNLYSNDKEPERREYERQLQNKWEKILTLCIPGIIEFGKQIQLSDDWPIITYQLIGPYGRESEFLTNKNTVSIDEDSVTKLLAVSQLFEHVNTFENLDNKILYSIKRLSKSKMTDRIDDRVVDLAIAFEYLINTNNNEVTLQLCLKVIKLIDDNNTDENIFKNLKKFYSLRSHIIHGNKMVENTPDNNSIVDYTEMIVRRATIRLIELNQTFSHAVIDKALTKALHISKPLMELLIDTK